MRPVKPIDVGLPSARSAVRIKREWVEKVRLDQEHVHIRHFISSLSPERPARLGQVAREHWSIENRNHHKRDDSVWQEDRHRHRRINVAQNLALTRNALLAIIPFDEDRSLPSLIADYQGRKQLAIELVLNARPFP